MKERVVVFGDAIIAIILTIIVLELPIKYLSSGEVNISELLRAIGIYFISFCFVANLWFQTAYAFNAIDKVRNKVLVVYMLLLFSLSLVPSATRLLIEDTTKQTIIIYGILTLVVTMVMRRLIVSLTIQRDADKDLIVQKQTINILNRQDIQVFTFRVVLLFISYFFVHFALVIYLFLPITAFLQNIADREEFDFITSLNPDEQTMYYQDRKELWGNSINRYSNLIRNSLRNNDIDQWDKIYKEWETRIDNEINFKQEELKQHPISNHKLSHEIKQLQLQKNRMQRHFQHHFDHKLNKIKRKNGE